MKKATSLSVAFGLAVLSACSHRPPVQNVMVPPRVDLAPHEMIGVVDFGSPSNRELGEMTTRRFTEMARRDQGMIRVVDLGTRDEAMRSVGRSTWDTETFKALGRQHGVASLFVGEVTVSQVRPDVRVYASLRGGEVTATVDATLDARLIETATGASLWSSSGHVTQGVGHVSLVSGGPLSLDARDPEAAYGELVEQLVDQVTRDFRATWQQR